MSTKSRQRRRPTADTNTPTAPATPDRPTTVDPHQPSPAPRPKHSLTRKTRLHRKSWMTDAQGYATLAALLADIPTPHLHAWTDIGDDNAVRTHRGGTLAYHHNTHTLTWAAPCPQGTHHTYPLAAPGDLKAAATHLAWCTDRHTPTNPVRSLAQAFGHDTDRTLADTLTKSSNGTADTTELPAAQIAAGLAARTAAPADDHQPKEHPQP